MSAQLFLKANGRMLMVLIIITNTLKVSAQKRLTLDQAIDSTIANNIEIRQAQFDEAIAGEDLMLAKRSRLPTLNASVAAYRLFGRAIDPTTYNYTNAAANIGQGSVYADVTLFQGFAKTNAIKQNKYLLDANKSYVNKIKNDLTLSVLTTYLQVLANRDLLAASKQQLVFAREELGRQQKFFKVGQKTLADLSQARSQVANAEANQTNAQNEMERSYLILAHLMERDQDNAFVVVDPPKDQVDKLNVSFTVNEVYQRALQTNPDILVSTNQRLASEKAIAVARGQQLPSLSFGGGINTSYSSSQSTVVATQITGAVPVGVVQNSNATVLAPVYATQKVSFGDQVSHNFNQAVGFTLLIPISNGFSANINTRKAKLSYQSAQATEDLAKNNLRKTISEAVWDVHATQKKYQAAQVTYQSAVNAFKVIRQRYAVGLVNSLDINIAETDRNSAEFALIQTKYDLILKSKLIDYYLGNRITF